MLGSSLMCTSLAVSHNKWDSSEKPSKTNKSNKVLSLILCVLRWHPLLPSSPFVFLPPSPSPKSASLFIHSLPLPSEAQQLFTFFFSVGKASLGLINKCTLRSPATSGGILKKDCFAFSSRFGRCWCLCSAEPKRVTEEQDEVCQAPHAWNNGTSISRPPWHVCRAQVPSLKLGRRRAPRRLLMCHVTPGTVTKRPLLASNPQPRPIQLWHAHAAFKRSPGTGSGSRNRPVDAPGKRGNEERVGPVPRRLFVPVTGSLAQHVLALHRGERGRAWQVTKYWCANLEPICD